MFEILGDFAASPLIHGFPKDRLAEDLPRDGAPALPWTSGSE
jgi:hypothetical protein